MIDHEVGAEDDLGGEIGPRIKVDGKDSHTIVPAQPGFSTVSRLVDEGGKTLGLTYKPVIAWLITVEVWQENKPEGEAERMCFPTPITADGVQGDGYRSWRPIRLPDGTFEFPEVTVDSEAAAIEYLEEQHAQEEMGRLRPIRSTEDLSVCICKMSMCRPQPQGRTSKQKWGGGSKTGCVPRFS